MLAIINDGSHILTTRNYYRVSLSESESSKVKFGKRARGRRIYKNWGNVEDSVQKTFDLDNMKL